MSERDIFTAARQMPDPAERAAFIAGACAGDAALRSRLEALLRAYDRPDSLLDAPALGMTRDAEPGGATRTHGAGADADAREALSFLTAPGRPDSLGRLGHYEVLEVLGRGGFGI